MIRRLVDFALNKRLLVLALAVLLFVWGVVSFHNLPVEAYPDVANNYVQVITQWPGRSAEEVEQQVTIPLEIVMNGIPHLAAPAVGVALRAVERDDGLRRQSENDWNREKVLERLSRGQLAARRASRRWAPTGAPSARSTSTRCTARIRSTTSWS